MQGRFFRLSLRQNFSLPSILEHRRTCDRTAPAALHRRLNVGLSSYAPAPNATASSSAVSAQTGRICIKTSRDALTANIAEHRENFAARKIQPRPAVSPDLTECGTAQKMHIFQTSKRRQPRRRTRRHALRSSNTDAFKMPLKRLADAFASIQISLKAKKSQTFARARACATKTGARTRQ